LAQRVKRSGKKRFVLLALSDFDPDGEGIVETLAASLRDEFHLDVTPVKVALTAEQVKTFDLKPMMSASDKESSRRQRFIDKFGDSVYELEAIEPGDLEQILRDAIEAVIDMDLYRQEYEIFANEAAQLEAIREQVMKAIAPIIRTCPDGDVA
jgi:hypothetical protein